jgi:uncharacterized protein YgiM (DUF1202 family)
MQAMDKAIADSFNKANAEKAAKEQTEQTPQSVTDQPEPVQTVKVKSIFKTVNVRSEPSKQATIVTTLPGGMEVAKVGETTGWVQVKLDMEDGSQVVGWISDETIETVEQ